MELLKKKVIIDTHMGIDDALALTFLSACREIEILTVTLIQGNAAIEIITETCERVLTALKKREIPIFLSGSVNLSGLQMKSDEYYGKSGFADIFLAKRKMGHRTDMSSAQALLYYAKKYPKQIHLLCLGPLTNVALAYLLDNKFPSLLASLTFAGSDTSAKTIRNTTEFAEFNSWCDPLALKIIMKNFDNLTVPIRLFDWNFSLCNRFEEIFDKIISSAEQSGNMNAYTKLLMVLVNRDNHYIQKDYCENGFICGDLLAALSVFDSKLFTYKKIGLQHVDISGPKSGHTNYQDKKHGTIDLANSVNMMAIHDILLNKIAYTLHPPKSKKFKMG